MIDVHELDRDVDARFLKQRNQAVSCRRGRRVRRRVHGDEVGSKFMDSLHENRFQRSHVIRRPGDENEATAGRNELPQSMERFRHLRDKEDSKNAKHKVETRRCFIK